MNNNGCNSEGDDIATNISQLMGVLNITFIRLVWKEKKQIFLTTIGTHLEGRNLARGFKKRLERVNEKKRFHDLRHNVASLLLNNGVPVLVVSKILGHSKTSTTLDIYGHLIPTMQSEAAQTMDDLITPIKLEVGENIDAELKLKY